ncbi:hypothetical protein [Snodgrassella sp. CFCC 13594]|uniref:hypothetical protein n=1 Tax=Snodgrassella sp. CFCC 13594 TaxID=1775559 RepID=UPI00082970DD|nr:hypothetical protein [Snodgrassella sp. CFCC 13594]
MMNINSSHVNELLSTLKKKEHEYQKIRIFFYVSLSICILFFIVGIFIKNVMSIAGGFVTAMMLGMGYLGAIMIYHDEINDLKRKIKKLIDEENI